MARPILSKRVQGLIATAVDQLYDRVKARFLGPDSRKKYGLGGKQLIFSFVPELTLGGLFNAASREEGAAPHQDTLDGLQKIAAAYLDASREKTKAKAMHTVQSFLKDAQSKGVKTDVKKVLGGHITTIWKEATSDVKRIIETETTIGRNVSIMDAAGRIAALQGVSDPVVFFIPVKDKDLCEECRKIHLMPDGITPRLWRQSELKSGYHEKGEEFPSVGGLHPHCFTGNQRLFTSRGVLTLSELSGQGPLEVLVDARIKNRRKGNNQFGEKIPGVVWLHRHSSGTKLLPTSPEGVYETGMQECLRITLDSGHTLEVSLGHEQWVDDNGSGKKVRASDLEVGDKVPLISGPGYWGTGHNPILAELAGNLMGDGSMSKNNAIWNFFGNDLPYGEKLLEMANSFGRKITGHYREPDAKYNVRSMRFSNLALGRKLIEFGVSKKPRRVPAKVWLSDQETAAAFIRGLFAADGHIEAHAVVFGQNDLEFTKEVQILLNNFGIPSRIFKHGDPCEKEITYADGRKYNTNRKECWRLMICGCDGIKKFRDSIGMGVPVKDAKLQVLCERISGELGAVWRTSRIASIESIGPQQTYCLTEPMTNTVTVNGIVTGQCRCVLSFLSPGFGFKNGRVTYISPGFDALKDQRG
jgi:hypothetical protein